MLPAALKSPSQLGDHVPAYDILERFVEGNHSHGTGGRFRATASRSGASMAISREYCIVLFSF